jgi:hypothetical protein
MTSHLDQELVARFVSLDGEARDDALRHAAGCTRCRERLAASDPSRLFALLALESPDGAALERLSESVMQQVEERRSAPQYGGLLRRLAPVAASLLLAGTFGIYMTGENDSGQTASLAPRPVAPAPSNGIELISSPGDAQVMEFTVGETQIVMIFDEAMDI